jgi:phosphoglycerol transferase
LTRRYIALITKVGDGLGRWETNGSGRREGGREIGAELTPQVVDGPIYHATLAEGISFARQGCPEFVQAIFGVSAREEWGRWSDGPKVVVRFKNPLPRKFTLLIEGYAFARNTQEPIKIKVGRVSRHIRMDGNPAKTYAVDFEHNGRASLVEISIPHPIAPADLWPGKTEDKRKLGISLSSLKIQ